MNKFFQNRFVALAALLSVFGGKTSGLNVSKIAEKTSREGVSTGENFSLIKTSGIQKKSLSNPLKCALLSIGAAGAAGLGALGYHVSSSLFGEIAQGKKFFIKYFKYFKINEITFNALRLQLFNSSGNVSDIASVGAYYNSVAESKLEGHELDKAIVNTKKKFYFFLYHYRLNLMADLFNIAYKYSIEVYGSKGHEHPEFFSDYYVSVKPSDGKLSVQLFRKIPNTEKNRMESRDITAEFNIDNPQTDEEKRKKGFYDELVKYVNNDDVMKQILLDA